MLLLLPRRRLNKNVNPDRYTVFIFRENLSVTSYPPMLIALLHVEDVVVGNIFGIVCVHKTSAAPSREFATLMLKRPKKG